MHLGATYPLDLVRSRLSIATASIPVVSQTKAPAATRAHHTARTKHPPASELTVLRMAMKVVREECGIRALYRGIITTGMGVAPYVGLNFATYEALRGILTPPGKTSVIRKLTCGALAGRLLLCC